MIRLILISLILLSGNIYGSLRGFSCYPSEKYELREVEAPYHEDIFVLLIGCGDRLAAYAVYDYEYPFDLDRIVNEKQLLSFHVANELFPYLYPENYGL